MIYTLQRPLEDSNIRSGVWLRFKEGQEDVVEVFSSLVARRKCREVKAREREKGGVERWLSELVSLAVDKNDDDDDDDEEEEAARHKVHHRISPDQREDLPT